MKNIILSLFVVILASACSSGTTVADLPFNLTGVWQGEFENSTGARQSTFTLNIVEDQTTGVISGNIIFADEGDDDSGCTYNGLIDGATSGFTAEIVAEVSGTITTIEEDETTGEVTADTETVSGTINYQLTQSNNGNTLTGTYVTLDLSTCSNASGSGSVVITRI